VPPGGQVLDQLLELADAANMANVLLDDAKNPLRRVVPEEDPMTPKRRLLEIQGNLTRVLQLARDCDQYLDRQVAALSSAAAVR
jgi:hypothetical protein